MFPPPCDAECLRQRPSVLDTVKVPNVKPGKYVVGFRYDCDATAQVLLLESMRASKKDAVARQAQRNTYPEIRGLPPRPLA